MTAGRNGPRLPGTRAANGGRRKGTKTARRAARIAGRLAEGPCAGPAVARWYRDLPESQWARGMWDLARQVDRALDYLQREGYAEHVDSGGLAVWKLTKAGAAWIRMRGEEAEAAGALLGTELDAVLEGHDVEAAKAALLGRERP